MRIDWFKTDGTIAPVTLVASAIVAFLSLISFLVLPAVTEPVATMYIDPQRGVVTEGKELMVHLIVEANTPVNVFSGQIQFDPSKLEVTAIDYNTSIADLWAEKPWFANGEGTINFIGGTTQKGGFNGKGKLMTITFKTLSKGEAIIRFYDARILAHNGLGTDVPLSTPIDALFTINDGDTQVQTRVDPKYSESTVIITPSYAVTDLNHDGKQTIIDVSMFMQNMFTYSAERDFNGDGSINSQDLSVLLNAR